MLKSQNAMQLEDIDDLATAIPIGNTSSQFHDNYWKDRIEIISKLAIMLLGLAYGIGLIILNLHIRRFGVSYLNFLQIEYILVGMLWILLLGSVFAGLLVIDHVREFTKPIVDKNSGPRWRAKSFRYFLILLTIISVYFVLSQIIAVASNGEIDSISILGIGSVLNFALTIAVCRHLSLHAKVVRHAIAQAKFLTSAERKRRLAQSFEFVLSLLIFSSLLTGYAYKIFPKMSPAFGGGSFQRMQFVIKPDAVPTFNVLGIASNPESRTLEVTDVIFEAPDFFVIAPPQGLAKNVKAIRVRKDLVDSAIYLSDR
jgi:hypothetical protein